MTNKRIVFHVPFRLGYAISGGGIRPGKLISAFESLGYAVDVVSGDKASRERAMDDIRTRLKRGEKYAFCYAENSVLPTMLTEKSQKPFYPFVDFDFFSMLKDHGLKIGLFYRDIFWKFNFYLKDRSWAERLMRKFFYHLDFYYYKKLLDVFFLPSMRMAYLLPSGLRAIATELPPGHDVTGPVERPAPRTADELRMLYVGGVSAPMYDLTPLMRLGEHYRVTVSTRQEEWPEHKDYYGRLADNVDIRHYKGESLIRAYATHHVLSVVRADHEYLKFNIPIKLFEAIGQNFPLLVSEGSIVGEYVREHGLGWVIKNDFSDFDPQNVMDEYEETTKRLIEFKPQHHWRVRARRVERLLGQTT